jgi:cell division protein FtsB
MTFIQPNRSSNILSKILIVLAACLVLGGLSLIVLYNRMVNFNHGAGEMKAEYLALQSQNAEIKDEVLKLFDVGNDSAVLSGHKLIEDKNPQYLEIDSKWSYASGQ